MSGRLPTTIDRRWLFAAFTSIAFANGAYEVVSRALANGGLQQAILNGFEISVIVWAALFCVLLLLARSRSQLTNTDIIVAFVASIGLLVPLPAASWVALSGFGFYLWFKAGRDDALRGAGIIMMSMSVPMLWSRLLFASFSDTILRLDAVLVGGIVGTGSVGNAVPFSNGQGFLFLAPACSSIANLSLAILCGILFVVMQGLPWSRRVLATIALAGASTIIINVARIATIGLFPAYYDSIHGPLGAGIAQWLSMAAMLIIYVERLKPFRQRAFR